MSGLEQAQLCARDILREHRCIFNRNNTIMDAMHYKCRATNSRQLLIGDQNTTLGDQFLLYLNIKWQQRTPVRIAMQERQLLLPGGRERLFEEPGTDRRCIACRNRWLC